MNGDSSHDIFLFESIWTRIRDHVPMNKRVFISTEIIRVLADGWYDWEDWSRVDTVKWPEIRFALETLKNEQT